MARLWIKGEAGSWAGGRIALDKDGDRVWVIQKMVGPSRHNITLQVDSERKALIELARFEEDPERYSHRTVKQPIVLDDAAISDFIAFKNRAAQSKKHVFDAENYLKRWQELFGPRDIRSFTTADLLAWLDGRKPWTKPQSGRKHLLIHLKAFTNYRRSGTADLEINRDPSLALRMPAVRAARTVKAKDYSIADTEKLYRNLDNQAMRDMLLVHAKTGLHGSEVSRLIFKVGGSRVDVVEGQGAISAVLHIIHKSGDEHLQSIDAQTLCAVQRLVARGYPPDSGHFHRKLQQLCTSLKLPAMAMGRFRHAFVSWLSQCGKLVHPSGGEGLPLTVIRDLVGHRNAETTDVFYRHQKIPPMGVVPLALHHPQDPVPLASAAARPVASPA